MKLKALAAVKLGDPAAERARDSHAQAIVELQSRPAAALTVLGDVVVPNSGFVSIGHPLGREPLMVITSPPKVPFGTPGLVTGGILIESTSGGGSNVDRTKQIRLFASGYGIPVTVTVAVL